MISRSMSVDASSFGGLTTLTRSSTGISGGQGGGSVGIRDVRGVDTCCVDLVRPSTPIANEMAKVRNASLAREGAELALRVSEVSFAIGVGRLLLLNVDDGQTGSGLRLESRGVANSARHDH